MLAQVGQFSVVRRLIGITIERLWWSRLSCGSELSPVDFTVAWRELRKTNSGASSYLRNVTQPALVGRLIFDFGPLAIVICGEP